jgi:hypothetical protein
MKTISSFTTLFAILLLTACGGGSSDPADTTDAGTTDGGTTSGEQMDDDQSTDGGNSNMLADIAGVWDMSIAGDMPRAEYWSIEADGTFNTYTYRDLKDIYIADAGQSLQVERCFERQTNTISASGNGVYAVQGLFTDERYGAGSVELDINADGTLQAKYVSDTVVCGPNGCFTGSIDSPFPRAANDFSAEDLYLCPSSIVPVSSLITTETDINSGNYWNCSFVNQDDRTAELTTAQVRIGADGQGLVTVDGNERAFSWFSRRDSDLTGDYVDGTGTFTLTNLILNSSDGNSNGGFSALDRSTRFGENGTATVTYFEMDCALVTP